MLASFRVSLTAAACAALTGFLHGAAQAAPQYPDIMPLKQVKAGMKGYGLTVFRGTKIERFNVTVVDVIKKGSLVVSGRDMILVRMSGGPMTQRGAYLIRGMSGSPVYVNGKLIGAFSQGEPTSKEPLGGVTPIEDMLETWDPKLPTEPITGLPDNKVRTVTLDRPLTLGDRLIKKVVYNAPLKSGLRSNGSTLVMHPCTTFATFSSPSRAAREKLAKLLEPYNVELAQQKMGSSRLPGFKGAPLVPGAAFSMQLATGDLDLGATGTVTYRQQKRILGFGHPFMGIGPIEAALTSAYVHDVYPLTAGSYKISSPGPIVGASVQDRNFAVSGILGRKTRTIPVMVDVRDKSTGRSRVFHINTITHPNLWAALVSIAATSSVAEIRNIPGPVMARVTTTVDAEEIGKVSRENIVFDARGIDTAATSDLDELLSILTSNPFYPLTIRSAQVKVEMESGRETAQVDRIFLKEGRFEPGETVELGVVLKPFKKPAETKTVKLEIPKNAPNGRYVIQVRGGAVPAGFSFGGITIRNPNAGGSEQAPPVNVRQMVNRYLEREKNNEVVARLLLTSTAVNVEGEKMTNLPPSLDAVMRSAKSSGVRMERDEVKTVASTNWVVSGQQVLSVNVQRPSTQETPGQPSPGGIPLPGGGGTGIGASTGPDFGGDDDELDARTFAVVNQAPKPTDTKKDDKPAAGAAEAKAQDTEPKPAAPQTTPAPAAPAAQEGPTTEKPVARAAQTWRQTTRADFARGDSKGVSVTTKGNLALTRSLRRVESTTEGFLWSLAADGQGGLYAGTGTQGRVLHLDSAGKSRVLADLPEINVHAVLAAPDGTVWAATAPNGRVYKITPDGKYTVAYEAPEKYALALARDSKGAIYVGTGGGTGRIYRIGTDGKAAKFYETSVQHVLALTVDRNDNLYAGTSTEGLIYKVTPEGKGSVVYDSPQASITAVGVNDTGDLFAATAPQGVVYRITPAGAVTTLVERAPAALTTLAVGPRNTVYAGGGNTVYAISPDGTVSSLENRTDVDILALAVNRSGTLFVGTGNVAEVYAADPAGTRGSGAYESAVHDAKQTANWGSIRWNAVVPRGSNLRIETRSGNVAEPDTTWSEWQPVQAGAGSSRVASPPARFLQYRILLDSDEYGESPSLRDIAVTYLPQNQAPRVTFQAPAGGEQWAGRQSLKWNATDPDKDTLSYTVFYSADFGKTWNPLPSGGTVKSAPAGGTAAPGVPMGGVPDPTAAPGSVESRLPLGTGAPSLEQVKAELDRHPDMPAALRQAILDRAGRAAQPGQQSPQPGSVAAAPTRAATLNLDTKTLPDGVYILKVVASDAPSNPQDAQTAEAVSEAFTVANAPPVLVLYKTALKTESNRSVVLEGAALQPLIAVSAVQYRVDNGEWVSAVPGDGIFDSSLENFRIATEPLSPGSHTIEVKAFSAASLVASEKITVEVK